MASNTGPQSNAMWGGRFSQGVCGTMELINSSIHVDKRLYQEDIQASIAHCQMLASAKIIGSEECGKIVEGLKQIREEMENGKFQFSVQLEDIHMNVEARLAEIVGKALAGRLHTARSRNDQVAVDFRLWLKKELQATAGDICQLMQTLLAKAEQHVDTIMPGFTHLQCAQPITFGHHCMAYVEMLGRDLSRAKDALERMDECPLGAGALAGTSFPINRHMTSAALGFREPTRNSMDSVSDRDFALEFLSLAAICGTHLSRLAEELVLWSTSQFNFVRLSDAYSTGSSIMPQKRNADAAELVRAKTGRINGNLLSLLTVMKALPLSYAKDLQEDKEMVFDTADTLRLMLQIMAGMIADMTVNEKTMEDAASVGFSTATDLADWLVSKAALPFREAHHIAGRAVALAERKGAKTLAELSLGELQDLHPAITEDVFNVMSVQNSVKSRTSFGGTASSEVRKQICYWKNRLNGV